MASAYSLPTCTQMSNVCSQLVVFSFPFHLPTLIKIENCPYI
uniref:Uncharacterized protein n=1 Tax=Meloidogyne enterolobii TaxID=390850 RepID=A0A6V7U0D0_MELEN|nr:unnamed protein product [Meloidogyne enterolobii]